jgi:hypothetical protein
MKISPEEIRVIVAGPMLYLYRDRTLVEETDSLRRPTGILHACGLFRIAEKTSSWIPGKFSFRKEKAKPATLPIDKEPLEWLLAGVILGERTVRYRKNESVVYVDPGRLEDQSIAARIWRDWLTWRNLGSPGTFPRFTSRGKKLRFGEDQRIHKIVQRLGLSVS